MSEKKLSAKLRTGDFGSAGSRRLVRAGQIPAVIYGKDAPLHVILSAREFGAKKHTFGETTIITLSVEGEKEHSVFVKDVQDNLLKNVIQHVDFFEVTFGQLLRTKVRIELQGVPTGVRDGGVLDQVMHDVEIECYPRNLPESIVLDVTKLAINDTLRVSDIPATEDYKILEDVNAAIASVKAIKEEVVTAAPAADAAAAAAPAAGAAPAADAAPADAAKATK